MSSPDFHCTLTKGSLTQTPQGVSLVDSWPACNPPDLSQSLSGVQTLYHIFCLRGTFLPFLPGYPLAFRFRVRRPPSRAALSDVNSLLPGTQHFLYCAYPRMGLLACVLSALASSAAQPGFPSGFSFTTHSVLLTQPHPP